MTQPPPPPPQQPYYSGPPQQMSPPDEKMWSILVHLSGIVISFVGPLVGYLVLKDRGPYVRFHTAQALNLQLTLLIGYVAGSVLSLVFIGVFLIFAVAILGLVLMIMAAVKASQGEFWKIPMTIPFVQ